MRITILGTGPVARTLGGGLVAAGHEIVFGSREPASKSGLPGEVRDTVASLDGADLVISALQASAALEALAPLADALADHILLDLGNAVTPSFDLMYPNASLGQALQDALPRTRVVKSLNTIPLATAVNPGELATTSNLFLSGDDADAKALVSGILVDLGWPVSSQIDLGGIATAKGPEHWFPLFAALMPILGRTPANLAIVRANAGS